MRFGLKWGFADRFLVREKARSVLSRPVRQTWDGRNAAARDDADRPGTGAPPEPVSSGRRVLQQRHRCGCDRFNDPSAGSPRDLQVRGCRRGCPGGIAPVSTVRISCELSPAGAGSSRRPPLGGDRLYLKLIRGYDSTHPHLVCELHALSVQDGRAWLPIIPSRWIVTVPSAFTEVARRSFHRSGRYQGRDRTFRHFEDVADAGVD